MKIAITGATGFIGTNLVRSIVSNGHTATAIVREQSVTSTLPESVEFRKCSLFNHGKLLDIVGDADSVVHLAAFVGGPNSGISAYDDYRESRIRHVNVEGTRSVVEAAEKSGVGHFVFASTIRAHPDVEGGDAIYVQTKEEAGKIVRESSLRTAIIYPTRAYGPFDVNLWRYPYFRRVSANTILVPPMIAPGRRNIVHVGDVADSIIHLFEKEESGDHLVTGTTISTRDLYKQIRSVLKKRCIIPPIPASFVRYGLRPTVEVLYRVGVSPVSGELVDRRANYAPLPKHMEETRPVKSRSFREAISDAGEWYRQTGLL